MQSFLKKYTVVLICSIYVVLALFISKHFPPVNSDEVVRSVIGLNRLYGWPAGYSLYDEIFVKSAYMMRDVLPDLMIYIYHFWLGAWTALKPDNFMASRLSSIIAGLLAILMFYKIGNLIGGRKTGIWCMILVAFSPFFIINSCIARPETLLLFTSAAILFLILKLPEKSDFKPLVIGAIAMFQLAIHSNASIMCAGLFTFYILSLPSSLRLKKGAYFIIGCIAGLLLILLPLDLKRLWLGFHTVHSALLRPPVFSWTWHPFEWLQGTLGIMWSGSTYYFDSNFGRGWIFSIRLWWIFLGILILLSLCGKYIENKPARILPWISSFFAVLFCSVLLVKAKDCIYASNYFVFLIPLAARSFSKSESKLFCLVRGFVVLILILSFILFMAFIKNYSEHVKPYDEIASELREMLPDKQIKLAGPSVLWYCWDKEYFRDSGSILLSHWYSGGRLDIMEWLEPWNPEIVILDNPLQNLIKKNRFGKRNLSEYFNCPVDLIGSIDTFSAYGTWEIYRIKWPENSDY